jgi:quercetin dioxygenase-like cupin family protein
MKRLILILTAAGLATAGIASGSARAPISAQVLGGAQVVKPLNVRVAKSSDLLFLKATVQPGGSFGWHTHRSAVAVAILAGTLTLYDSSSANCAAEPMTAGHGFVEPANHVHLARNEGKTPVRLLVAYLGAPHGKTPDVPAAKPARCEAVQ